MNPAPAADFVDLARATDFALGNLRVRPSLREVSAHGNAEMLEPRVMQVLVAFARQRGEVVSRDRLVETCWGGRTVGEDAVNRCIARIRRLAESHGGFTIETIPRVGYRLTEQGPAEPDVRRSASANGVAPEPAGGLPAVAATADAVDTLTPPPRAGRRRHLVLGASLATVLIVIGVGLVTIFTSPKVARDTEHRRDVAVPLSRPRLALLPFQNLSSDPANAFFADGLHAEILSALSLRGATLDVVPRTTMMMYRTAPQAIARLASDLQATHVLEGSVRREGDSVRLTVQLFDARTQAYVWSQTYDRKLVSALTLQSEVTGEIVSQLTAAVAADAPQPAAPTANPQAYDLYLRARLLQDDDEPDEAEALLDRALTLDPEFGAAYAARAQSQHSMIFDNYDATEQRLALERNDVDAARRLLGSAAPLVLSLEAQYLDLASPDHAAAIRRMQAAEAAGLVDSTAARQTAMLLMLDDRLDESIRTLQSLAIRDPANILVLMSLAAELGLAQRPVEALRVRNVAMERYPLMVFPLLQGRLIFAFTGRTDVWRGAVDQHSDALKDGYAIFRTHWDLLRFEKRYADLRQALQSVPASSIDAITSGGFAICCVGRRPTAVYRGWAELLNDDASAAAAEGRKVLSFVSAERATRWNEWFLRTLVAEGSLLTGNKERAASAAREAIALMPRKLDTLRSRYASAVAARVLAWAGADEEAVTLLEELAVTKPGLGPAEITRDPLYSIPLAGNQRYQALVARLEIEMRNYAIELGKESAPK
jgi:TolB-like protein/DNA-binding winged helix-turn-helix (wHTH) protein